MQKIVIDTNVWVYAFDKSNIYHIKAVKMLQNEDFELFITPKQISEFIAVVSKKNIEMIDILDFVNNDMLANSILVYPNSQSIKIFTELCQKYNPKGNRVFDIEIVSITYALGIKNIATFNTKDFENIKEINLINN
jgi:predicted nucleic acid-binding protein